MRHKRIIQAGPINCSPGDVSKVDHNNQFTEIKHRKADVYSKQPIPKGFPGMWSELHDEGVCRTVMVFLVIKQNNTGPQLLTIVSFGGLILIQSCTGRQKNVLIYVVFPKIAPGKTLPIEISKKK